MGILAFLPPLLWLCSLKLKHKYPVLVQPIKIMGRRGGSNVHLVVIDYGHLVRSQLFHIMSDHKLPGKAVSVASCLCAAEAGARGWLGWQLIAPGRSSILPGHAAACTQCFLVDLGARMCQNVSPFTCRGEARPHAVFGDIWPFALEQL